MDQHEITTESLITVIVWLAGFLIFPVTLVIPLVFHLIQWWRKGAPKREAKRRQRAEEQEALRREALWAEARKRDLELQKIRMEIEAKKPPPPTKQDLIRKTQEEHERELRTIDETEKDPDTREAMKAFKEIEHRKRMKALLG